MSSVSLVRNCDCVMLIVANRSGCDVVPRGPDYPKCLNPEDYDSQAVKKFQEGTRRQRSRSPRTQTCLAGVHISLVLLHIGVVFSWAPTNSFSVFCLTYFTLRLLEPPTLNRE